MEEVTEIHPPSATGAASDYSSGAASDSFVGAACDDSAGLRAARRPACTRLLWLVLIMGVLAAAVWSYDQPVSERVVAARERIEAVLGPPATAGAIFIPLAILFSFRNWRRLLVGFVVPIVASAAITQALKWLIGRARPDQGLGPHLFDSSKALDWGGYQSFPSGDATTAIVLALLLGLYFPRARWVFYVYAGFVGLHRIMLARHFTSDVLAGYIVGATTVYLCVRLLGPAFYERDLPRGAPR